MQATFRCDPLFSVITVCRNADRLIEKTIISVLSQTRTSFEYIVVDGYSDDKTRDIIARYSNRIQKFVSEPDEGIADAMNKGARLARGTLMIFMNAGDTFYDDDVLRKTAESHLRIGWDWAVAWTRLHDSAGRTISEKVIYRFSKRALHRYNFICHQSAVVRKASFDRAGTFRQEFKTAMDYDLWLRLAAFSDAHALPFFFSNYLIGGVSSNTDVVYRECRSARRRNLQRGPVRWLYEESMSELWYRTTDWSLVYKVKRHLPKGIIRALKQFMHGALLRGTLR